MTPDEAVEAARCLECDWRYYALSMARARNWADAHSEEKGHSVQVTEFEDGNKVPEHRIPEAAVEAAVDAARAFYEGKPPRGTRAAVRAALEAAAPHIQAQALVDAVDAFPLETIHAPDTAVVWMMRRAEELRGCYSDFGACDEPTENHGATL